jgi:hypothetical protein
MARAALSPLESLNRSLQSSTMTIAGMLESTKIVQKQFVDIRLDEKFAELLSEVEQQITEFSLDPLVVPRERKPPARFCGSAEAFHANSVEVHFRIQYFKPIDAAVQQLDDRLLKCPGLARYCQLESTLLSGQINDIVRQYPELGEAQSLKTQLDMFLPLPQIASASHLNLEMCTEAFRTMMPEIRAMFPNVESHVRLLIVNPASSRIKQLN